MLCSLVWNSVPVWSNDGDYYASIAGLEKLLKTEQILLEDLKNFIETSTEPNEVLEKWVNLWVKKSIRYFPIWKKVDR